MPARAYDAENHLISAGGQTYLYDAVCASRMTLRDGDGKRVEKASGSPLTANKLYWYDQEGNAIYETDAAGYELFRYFRFGGLLVAREEGNDWVDHYGLDALGNVRWVYATNGQTLSAGWDISDYYPFGGERVWQSNSTNSRKFTSKERDPESGNDNFDARYYSSSLGRFMSPDPPLLDQHIADPQSWNLYSYARNNPLSYIDPTGNAVELLGDEEQRKKELAFLQKSLGNDKAASNLYINEVKDGDKTRYFVGIKGDVGDFMKMGATSHDLANLVQNKNVVEFGLTSQDLSRQGGAVTYEKGEAEGGNQNVRVLVNPDQAYIANRVLDPNTVLGSGRFEGQNQDPRWRVNPFTGQTMTWHEFGHAWASINGRSLDRSNPEAFQWENRMREQLYGPLGPNNARRIAH